MKTIIAFLAVAVLPGHLTTDRVDDLDVSSLLTLAIDPGHGGKDEGMSFNGAIEKDITLAIAKEILDNDLGLTSIVLLRAKDSHVPMQKRIAAGRSRDLYISIHLSFNESLGSGPSVFYSSKGPHAESSKGYAEFFATHLTDGKERAQETQVESYVLDNLKCPGILINAGNIGTITDFYLLTSKEGQQQFAQEIAKVIKLLSNAKREHALVVKARSSRPKIDSLFYNSVKKVGEND